MSTISAKLKRNYKNVKGNTVFVYELDLDAAALGKYKEASGDYYREDDQTKKPLWFTTRCIGQKGTLIITEKNKIIADMSAYEQAASLAAQFGGNFGTELAKATVQQLLGNKPQAADEQSAD